MSTKNPGDYLIAACGIALRYTILCGWKSLKVCMVERELCDLLLAKGWSELLHC